MTTNTAAMSGESRRSNGFSAAIAQAVEAYRRSRARRRTQVALASLEDHVLRDIGLDPNGVRRPHRAMVDWVVQTNRGTARLVFIGR
jgi:uncharacterized protein YjiS (DUF1127 family)